jgi:hypothetical protein
MHDVSVNGKCICKRKKVSRNRNFSHTLIFYRSFRENTILLKDLTDKTLRVDFVLQRGSDRKKRRRKKSSELIRRKRRGVTFESEKPGTLRKY